jgi:hypothetical protein
VKISLSDWKMEELKHELHKIDKELTLEELYVQQFLTHVIGLSPKLHLILAKENQPCFFNACLRFMITLASCLIMCEAPGWGIFPKLWT